jgi:hypothetical protein
MPDQDLVSLVVDALGKRIDDPAAVRLAEALGKKPFKSATPTSDSSLENSKLGLAVGAKARFTHRDFFPPRKEGRTWVTRVSHAFVYPRCAGALPEGFDWQMDDAALGARFERRVDGALEIVRYVLPPPRAGLRATVSLNDAGRPKHLLLGVAEEEDYATVYPGEESGNHAEDAFFASWCALNGLLREDRLGAAQMEALRERRLGPQDFLVESLGGLFWEHDVQPAHAPFCHAYMGRLMEPEEASALFDAKAVFGEHNAWRKEGEAPTEATWTNFDRIAPRYAERFAQFQRREIRSMVHHPQDGQAGGAG